MFKPKNESNRQGSLVLQEDDIFADIVKKEGSTLFLGKYTLLEAGIVFKKRSFVREAKKRKLWPVKVLFDSSEFPPLQRLQIFLKDPAPDNLIVDLKLKEGYFRMKKELPFDFDRDRYHFLMLEWLTLQNPLLSFSHERRPLPGQKLPGLNLGRKVLDLFVYLARLNMNDGILVFPAYFHNAILFSRRFHFLNPAKQAEFDTIRTSFKDIPFNRLAWVVHLDCLKTNDKKTYKWKAEEQILPLDKGLKRYFESDEYKEEVQKARKHFEFDIDWGEFEKKMKNQVHAASKPE